MKAICLFALSVLVFSNASAEAKLPANLESLVKSSKKCILQTVRPKDDRQEEKGHFLKIVCDSKRIETKELSSGDQAGLTGELIARLFAIQRSISDQCTEKTVGEQTIEECPIVPRS